MNTVASKTSLQVRQLFDRDSCTYTYLLFDYEKREAVIIDPVKEQLVRDLRLIEELGLELLYTIESHVHADHITSSGLIRQRTGAQVVFSCASEVKGIDLALNDGDTVQVGNFIINAITTPGHTFGCMSFYVDGMLFTGDALFVRGCGRTDFQEGDAGTLFDSITQKLFVYSNETRVYPGHDYNGRLWSTVGEEKQWNPRISEGTSREQFIETMMHLNLAVPKKINEAVPINSHCGTLFDPKRYLHDEMTIDQLYSVWNTLLPELVIVDVRTPEVFSKGHVPKSINIPLGCESKYVEPLMRYKNVYFYSQTGRAAQTAFTSLTLMGMDNLGCVGHSGFPEWVTAGYQVESL